MMYYLNKVVSLREIHDMPVMPKGFSQEHTQRMWMWILGVKLKPITLEPLGYCSIEDLPDGYIKIRQVIH